MYLKRHAEEAVYKFSAMFGAVLAAGPRQAGTITIKGEDRVIPIHYL